MAKRKFVDDVNCYKKLMSENVINTEWFMMVVDSWILIFAVSYHRDADGYQRNLTKFKVAIA